MHTIDRKSDEEGPACRLGCYRVCDGSDGATVGLDVNRPHAAVAVGRRGSGKSHTLGVMAEGLVRAAGVTSVIIDPMGVFCGLTESPIDAAVHDSPRVRANASPPSAWPELLGLDPTAPVGSLVWRLAVGEDSLVVMHGTVGDDDAAPETRRVATNHLALADLWDVFHPEGFDLWLPCGSSPDMLDLSGLEAIPTNAVVCVVARGLYDARVAGPVPRIPWLLLDEAHAFAGGLADPAFRAFLTRGRAPDVGVVLATQCPSALPEVAVSQADLRVVHRLAAGPDVSAMAVADPTCFDELLRARFPRERGCALVVDDTTETVHDVRVRPRETPDGGATPRAVSEPGSSETVE